MNQVATKQEAAVAPVNVGEGVLAVIARAAADPNVDIDKLERLLEMQERIMARSAQAEFDAALALVQPQLPTITEKGEIKNRQGQVQSTYALWEDINEAISPVLSAHGFSLNFRTRYEDNSVIVRAVLSHEGGHREETELPLPRDNSGAKNEVQAVGSSVSYGKRYTAGALLNLVSRGEDNDAQAVKSAAEPMTDEQRDLIQEMAPGAGKTLQQICDAYKVGSLKDLTAAQGDAIIKRLQEVTKEGSDA